MCIRKDRMGHPQLGFIFSPQVVLLDFKAESDFRSHPAASENSSHVYPESIFSWHFCIPVASLD